MTFDHHRSTVAPEAVPCLTRARVKAAVDLARRDLGLGPVEVVWVGAPAMAAKGAWGYVLPRSEPGKIYVAEDVPDDLAAATAAHECRHLHQAAKGTYVPRHEDPHDRSGSEADAVGYEGRIAPAADALADEYLAQAKARREAADRLAAVKAFTRPETAETTLKAFVEESVLLATSDVPRPFANRVSTLRERADWLKAARSRRPESPDDFVARILEERRAYEATVCARPDFAARVPFCQTRPDSERGGIAA